MSTTTNQPIAPLSTDSQLEPGQTELVYGIKVKNAAGSAVMETATRLIITGSEAVFEAKGDDDNILTEQAKQFNQMLGREAVRVIKVGTGGPVTVPDTTAPAAVVVTASNAGSMSGTAEAGSTIKVYEPDGESAVYTATTASNGSWSITFSPALTETRAFTLTATDAAGNVSTATSHTITIDAGEPDTTAPAAPAITQNTEAGLGGTAEAGSTITVTNSTGTTFTTTTNSNGVWLFGGHPLAEGETGTITATDAAGNISGETSVIRPEASEAPEPVDGVLGGTYEDDVLSYTGGVLNDEPLLYLVKPITGQSFDVTLPDIANLDSLAIVVSTEASNLENVTNSAVELNWDGTNLIVLQDKSIIEPLTGVAGNTLKGVLSNTVVQLDLLDGVTSLASLAIEKSSAGGVYLWIIAKPVSIESTVNIGIKITNDLIAPDAPIVNPSNGKVISGTAEPGSMITITANDQTYPTGTAGNNGIWQMIMAEDDELADGTEIQVTATDAAGNVSIATTAIVDATPPAEPVVTRNNISGVYGTAEPNSRIQLTNSADQTQLAEADEDGNWGFGFNPLDEDEAGVLVAIDEAGNISNPVNIIGGDQTEPEPATGLAINNDGDQLAGIAEPDSTVEVYADSTLLGTATADGDGGFAVTLDPAQITGTTLTVYVTDADGNTSAAATITI